MPRKIFQEIYIFSLLEQEWPLALTITKAWRAFVGDREFSNNVATSMEVAKQKKVNRKKGLRKSKPKKQMLQKKKKCNAKKSSKAAFKMVSRISEIWNNRKQQQFFR